jgi:hypothetical protein
VGLVCGVSVARKRLVHLLAKDKKLKDLMERITKEHFQILSASFSFIPC